jgi:hypothetical protein
MEFHFVHIKSGGIATIFDSSKQARYICFDKPKMAERYALYISDHKAKYGMWPHLDLSSVLIQPRLSRNHVPESADLYMELLDITHYSQDEVETAGLFKYFYCNYFEQTEHLSELHIQGEEVDVYPDDTLFRESLDKNIKNM